MDKEIKSPAKAIRIFCLECCGGSPGEVKQCVSKTCALHAFRFGKNPYTKRIMGQEEKNAAAERLKKAREEKKRR